MTIQKYDCVIFQENKGWVVYNKKKPFAEGHTHLRNITSAIAAAEFVHKKKIPKRCGFYYLRSLMRISADPEYTSAVQQLIDARKQKGKKMSYRNRAKT